MAKIIDQANQPDDDGSNLGDDATVSPRGPRVLDGYLTQAELAAELDVSDRTVARWNAEGTGPPRVLVGRKPYYGVSSARQWLESRSRATLRGPR